MKFKHAIAAALIAAAPLVAQSYGDDPAYQINPGNGHRYVLTPGVTHFDQARAHAESLGGYLVAINDFAEQSWLQATFGTDERLWIGLTDSASEGNFVWDSGEPTTFVAWCAAQPNDLSDQDYVMMNYDVSGCWNDVDPNIYAVGELWSRGIVEIPMGQQGDADRNYLVNGVGRDLSSVVNSALPVPGIMRSVYETNDLFAPVVWVMAAEASNAWTSTPSNSIDIGPAGIVTLGSGFDPGFIGQVFTTNAQADLSIDVNAPAVLEGQDGFFAMAHVAPSAPEGLWVSQTHRVHFGALAGSTVLPLGINDSELVNLGFEFEFYQQTFTQMHVNSNGNVTFGTGDSEDIETEAGFLNGDPRIAPFWDGWDPSLGGVVRYFTDGAGYAEVMWEGVPPLFGGASFMNTSGFGMSMSVDAVTGEEHILFWYSGNPEPGGLVGLAKGTNVGSMTYDLSEVGTTSVAPQIIFGASPYPSVYEYFPTGGGSLGFDLNNSALEFRLNSQGDPVEIHRGI